MGEKIVERFGSFPSVDRKPSVLRSERHPLIGVSDYFTDDPMQTRESLVDYYGTLHDQLGVNAIRSEFRMMHLIDDETEHSSTTMFRTDIHERYVTALQAMDEAELKPIIYLFNPSPWMYKLAAADAPRFMHIYKDYVHEVVGIFKESGVTPEYLQVMSEINWKAQTPLALSQVSEMIKATDSILKSDDQPDAIQKLKLMTTFSINSMSFPDAPRSSLDRVIEPTLGRAVPDFLRWQDDMKNVVATCGDALDGVGIDFYPGSYDKQSYSFGKSSLEKSRPYKAFGNVSPYAWIFEQKLHGFLQHKDIVIAETGVFSYNPDSRHGQFGMARMLQSLDGLLLQYQNKGIKADALLKGVFAFAAADNDVIHTMFPGKIDWKPWTLVRPDRNKEMKPTKIANMLRYMLGKYFPSVVSSVDRPDVRSKNK